MKKTLLIVLAVVLCISMCACGKDATPPTITMTKSSFEIEYGSEFDIADYANSINISDDKDGKIDVSELATDDKLDTTVEGTHKVTYYVRDSAGNIGTIDIEVTVLPETREFSSYSTEEHLIYSTIMFGMEGIKECLKVPDSVTWIEYKYWREKGLAYFYFSSENNLGGTVYSYAICRASDGYININKDHEYNYKNKADVDVDMNEVIMYIDAYNREASK